MYGGTVRMDYGAVEEKKKVLSVKTKSSTVTGHIVVHFLFSDYDCHKTSRALPVLHTQKKKKNL